MIRNILATLLANVIALYAAISLIPGMGVEGGVKTLAIAAVVMGVANTFIKPILKLISLPFIVLSMGVFLVVINGALLWVTQVIVRTLAMHPQWSQYIGDSALVFGAWTDYLLAAVIVGVINYATSWFFKLR